MTALYVIIGNQGSKFWPVCWRMDRPSANRVLTACESQRDDLIKRLSPLKDALDLLYAEQRMAASNRPRKGQNLMRHARYAALRQQADTTIKTWRAQAFDPLFPPWDMVDVDEPEAAVMYKIYEIPEDPTELDAKALAIARAFLWGQASSKPDEEESYADD